MKRTLALHTRFQNEAGWLGEITSRLGEAGVNVEVIYTAIDNRLALITSDMPKARQALSI